MPRTSLFVTLALVALQTTLAAAAPTRSSGNAYSEDAGKASGGNVKMKHLGGPLGSLAPGGLLSVMANNAGDGGSAESGSALGGLPIIGTRGSHHHADNNANAYAGKGGEAEGGDVGGRPAMISILSGNAGDGGGAASGSALNGLSDPFRDRAAEDAEDLDGHSTHEHVIEHLGHISEHGEDGGEDLDGHRTHEHVSEHHEHVSEHEHHEHDDDDHDHSHHDHHHHGDDCDC